MKERWSLQGRPPPSVRNTHSFDLIQRCDWQCWIYLSRFIPLELFFSQILDGLSIGSVLLLAATGLSIVFGLMGVINLAHGEFMMLGCLCHLCGAGIFKPMGGVFQLYFPVALMFSFIVTALVGVLLERTLIRKLYGRPLETLLATWGVSLVLIQLIRSISTAMLLGILAAIAPGNCWEQATCSQDWHKAILHLSIGLWWAISIGIGLVAVNALHQCPSPSRSPGSVPATLT